MEEAFAYAEKKQMQKEAQEAVLPDQNPFEDAEQEGHHHKHHHGGVRRSQTAGV